MPNLRKFAQPTHSEMHQDAVMTGISIAYKNPEYVADRIFPIVPVKKDSDIYYIYKKGPWFRNDAGHRAPGANAPESGYSLETGTYACTEVALKKKVPDEDRQNCDSPLDPDIDATEFVTNAVTLAREIKVAEIIKAWTAGEDAAGLWAPAGSTNTFLQDIRTGKEAIRDAIGRYPNRLLIDCKTYEALKFVDELQDMIKYTQRGVFTRELIASVCELDEVVVGKALYSDAEETAAGDDFNAVDIWDVNATKGLGFLYYAPSSPSLRTLAAGYIIRSSDFVINRYRDEGAHSDYIECSEKYAIEKVADGCGYLFTDTYLT